MIIHYLFIWTLSLGYAAGTELEDKLDSYGIGTDIIGEIPTTALNMTLDDNYVGEIVSPNKAKDKPFLVTWNLEEGEDEDGNDLYALVMIDPDAPMPQYLHWLVVNISKYLAKDGNVLASYEGPAPPNDKKPYHRYIFLLYRQSKKINDIDQLKVEDRTGFNVLDFAQENGLGSPIAANFFVAKPEEAEEETRDDIE
ncbi:phosphatidylethanolamine-binding protein domain-containing protein [Ditylenchus destructor]|uniref:Phosphatidylethanolamine-binding protein domain-containing protein n=1 Tax=Ditylenchus destructor TaxID=166010 RepID=A0AAD4MM27_9BILA|nr:phosphatidylethanolamine-binding protein domain-containing protein [Ditylenchus destructor]